MASLETTKRGLESNNPRGEESGQVATAAGEPARSGRGVVARQGLFDVLSGAERVTLVSAPAGSGKSVLLRSWIAARDSGGSVAWVSVGREERDPQRFWLSVLESLRGTDGGAQRVGAVTASPDLDGRSVVKRLLEDLSTLETPVWVVIDDLHELQADEAREQLESLLLRAPEQLRFVLVARRDLHLGLHRLRLDGDLTEIRAARLRFSLEESRALFEAAGVQLSDGALESLVAQTEGWATGLRLAALSLAGNGDPERFAADFSGSERTVAEYLLAEVLDRQPQDVSRLLLRTSILEEVNGPLADRLTGGSGSERILAELEEAGAFVVSVDRQGTWFRYHRLFADLLALELRRTAPGELPGLHAAAAAWFAEHGHPVEAIRHAQAAEDWPLAARLLFENWLGMYLDGNRPTAHGLLAAFPPGMVGDNAELALLASSDERMNGGLEEAERYLSLAERQLASVPDDRRGWFELELSGARFGLALARNDATAVAQQAERLALVVESDLPPEVGRDARAAILLTLGVAAIWTVPAETATAPGEDAERYLEQALALAERINRPFIELIARAHLAVVAMFRSASLAEQRGRQAIDVARAHGWADETWAGVAYTVLGTVALWRAQLSEAEQWIEQAEAALRAGTDPATGMLLYTSRALLEHVRGRHEQALTAFRAAQHAQSLLGTHTLGPAVRPEILFARVDMGEAERVREELDQVDVETRDALPMRVVRAALALEDDQPEEAAAALAPILDDPAAPATEARWGIQVVIQGLLLGATALDLLRDPGGASRALERALELAKANSVLLPFLLHPARDLLERHARLDTTHASLITEILDLLAGRNPPPRPGEVEPLLEPLSDTELRVLRYLPTSMQGPEIAAELFVSVNTIRTHMRHLYAKLGVHRRTDAVERARELGLLAARTRNR
jgi:LuxR family transcriptional regulator, maltose regulon positive regulatory protein